MSGNDAVLTAHGMEELLRGVGWIPDDACATCANVIFDTGVIEARPGRQLHANLTAPATGTKALGVYARYGTSDPVAYDALASIDTGGTLYVSTGAAQAYGGAEYTVGGSSPMVVDVTGRPRMAQYGNHLYVVDGVNFVRQCLNIYTASWTADSIEPDVPAGHTPHGLALDAGEKIFATDRFYGAVHRFAADGTYEGYYGYNDSATGWHATGGHEPVPGTGAGKFVTPRGLAFSADYATLYVADTGNSRVQQIAMADGTTTVLAASTALDDYTNTEANLLTLLGCLPHGGTVYPSYHMFDHDNSTFSVSGITPAGVAVDSDGHVIVTARITYTGKVVRQGGTVGDVSSYYTSKTWVVLYHINGATITRHYLFSTTASDYPTVTYESDTSYLVTYPDGLRRATIVQATQDEFVTPTTLCAAAYSRVFYQDSALYAVTDSAVQRITEAGGVYETYGSSGTLAGQLALATDALFTADGTLLVANAGNTRIERFTIATSSDTAGYRSLEDEPTPATAPLVSSGAGSTFVAGVHEWCYTFAILQGDGTYAEGPASSVTALTTGGASDLSIQAYTAGGPALRPGTDLLYLYYRCSDAGVADFRRQASLAVPSVGSDPALCTPTAINTDGDLLMPYVSRPPAGCSHLLEWQGQLVYAKGDTVYFSVWDDPTRTTPTATVDDPTLYGAEVRVGTDGGAITGMGKLGTYLVLFKARGMWLTSGTPGGSDFAVQQISTAHGCTIHESIAEIAGGLLAWLDGSTVWGWDGQGFREIGKPVANLLATHAAAQRSLAFATYNPETRYYQLTIPPASSTGGNDATSYVLHTRDDGSTCWTVWDGQPGACAVYTSALATAGVYAGDGYNTGLYRLQTGTADDDASGTAGGVATSWTSKRFTAPGLGAQKSVTRVEVLYGDATAKHPTTVTLANRTSMGATVTHHLHLTPGQTSVLERRAWLPPVLGDTLSYQLTVGAAAVTAAWSVHALALRVIARGRFRP